MERVTRDEQNTTTIKEFGSADLAQSVFEEFANRCHEACWQHLFVILHDWHTNDVYD
jgi:hypothetical protein